MGQNKEQLKKLLDFIDALTKEQGNEWFVEELNNRKKKTLIFSDSKIDDIYELCIEKIIQEQAEQFYKNFPIKEIILQLVEDFVRMEHFKRKDKFEDFCLAMYQQVECITNKISSDKKLNEIAEKIMGYPAYTDGNITSRQGDYQIAKLLFMKSAFEKSQRPLTEQYAIDKVRCIIYFVCYKANMQSTEYNTYVEMTDLMNELYQYRNSNHRGSSATEFQQKIYDKINPIKHFYYLKLMGIFATFIEKVSLGYPISQELIQYANGIKTKEVKLNEPKVVGFIDPSKLKRK